MLLSTMFVYIFFLHHGKRFRNLIDLFNRFIFIFIEFLIKYSQLKIRKIKFSNNLKNIIIIIAQNKYSALEAKKKEKICI